MAFVTKTGVEISYKCDDLIAELKEDIKIYGEGILVDVVVEPKGGAYIWKEYNIVSDYLGHETIGEFNQRRTTASILLEMYELQNEEK